MRRIASVFLLSGIFGLMGCMESAEELAISKARYQSMAAEAETLRVHYEQLATEVQLKDEFIREYTRLINRTLTNLEQITAQEGMLHQIRIDLDTNELQSGEAGADPIELRMNENLTAIQNYIAENERQRKQLIKQRDELRQLARQPNVDVKGFEATITKLNGIIAQRDATITTLREEASLMVTHIADLRDENTVLAEQNVELVVANTVLQEAYVVVDTRDNLQRKGIIDRKGGFLGIGKKTRLEKLDAQKFQRANVREPELFVGEGLSRYQILSDHKRNEPLFAFTERENKVYLSLNDAEEFWKISRYLVIEVKM